MVINGEDIMKYSKRRILFNVVMFIVLSVGYIFLAKKIFGFGIESLSSYYASIGYEALRIKYLFILYYYFNSFFFLVILYILFSLLFDMKILNKSYKNEIMVLNDYKGQVYTKTIHFIIYIFITGILINLKHIFGDLYVIVGLLFLLIISGIIKTLVVKISKRRNNIEDIKNENVRVMDSDLKPKIALRYKHIFFTFTTLFSIIFMVITVVFCRYLIHGLYPNELILNKQATYPSGNVLACRENQDLSCDRFFDLPKGYQIDVITLLVQSAETIEILESIDYDMKINYNGSIYFLSKNDFTLTMINDKMIFMIHLKDYFNQLNIPIEKYEYLTLQFVAVSTHVALNNLPKELFTEFDIHLIKFR